MWVYIGTKFVNGTYLFSMIDCDYADLSHESMSSYCMVTTYRNPLTPQIILCQSPPVLPSIGGMRNIKKTCVRCNKNPVFTRNICHELSGEDLGKRHLWTWSVIRECCPSNRNLIFRSWKWSRLKIAPAPLPGMGVSLTYCHVGWTWSRWIPIETGIAWKRHWCLENTYFLHLRYKWWPKLASNE